MLFFSRTHEDDVFSASKYSAISYQFCGIMNQRIAGRPPKRSFGIFFTLRLCFTNFVVQIIILTGPSKAGNTDSVSQNFKSVGKHTPGLRASPPPSRFTTDCRPCLNHGLPAGSREW